MLTEQQLKTQLEHLQEEIDRLTIDVENKRYLHDLVGVIEQGMTEPLESDLPPLEEQVKEAISTFEAEHPTLTAVLNNILVSLSSMGV